MISPIEMNWQATPIEKFEYFLDYKHDKLGPINKNIYLIQRKTFPVVYGCLQTAIRLLSKLKITKNAVGNFLFLAGSKIKSIFLSYCNILWLN